MAIRVLTNMRFHGRDSACSLLIGQTVTLFFFLIIVAPAFIITVHGQGSCNPATENPSYKCNHTLNYTKGSTVDSSLSTVLNNLGRNQNGFKISVSGQIYGLFQCRADLTVHQCYTCWRLATSTIRQDCGNAGGGSIWPFHCFLRYESYNFIGKLDTDSSYAGTCTDNSSDAGVFLSPGFDSVAENLLKNLSAEAARKMERSALGLSQTIYGMVQCTRDLSTKDCATCLSNAAIAFGGVIVGVQYWSRSCIIRYQIYPFFNLTALPMTPAEGPPKHITASSNGSKSTNKTHIIIGVVVGSVLVLVAFLFATGRGRDSAIFRQAYQGSEEMEENTLISGDQQIMFRRETLLIATNYFDNDNKLGEGGFGTVYKGTISGGKEIAVKKLSLKSLQGKKEFMNEVELVAKIQHRNLVNLLGCNRKIACL